MINNTELEFADISSEEMRTYDFSDMSVTIKDPTHLNVSTSGGHRILDASGISHYIPTGWRHLFWTVKAGQANFVK